MSDVPYDQDTDDPQEAVPDSNTETQDPQEEVPQPKVPADDPGTETISPIVPTPDPEAEDVFRGEQEEAARLEREERLVTDTDNTARPEDGDQPVEVPE